MYVLNTTRHLIAPASDETVGRLRRMLTEEIAPKAATLEGLRNISWMLSTDRMTLQAFSGWSHEDDLVRAERSAQHGQNGVVINELLGGLTQPQGHSYYRILGSREFA